MPETLLEVRDLRVHFDSRDGVVRAVDGVSFDLLQGLTLGVVGESGSGKSVTALSLMRLIATPPGRIEGGEVRFRGRNLLAFSEDEIRTIRGNEMAMVFQDAMASLNPVNRIGHQLAEPLLIHKGASRQEAMRRAAELLDMVGVPRATSRLRDYPHQFSGGVRQRVMIAMALMCDPAILIADEPTTALDVTTQAQILELLTGFQRRTGTAVILITHDLGVAAEIADSILTMYAGRVVECGPADEIFSAPAHPYTWGLIDSRPWPTGGDRRLLRPIKGQPPSLIRVPAGCAFHPRCPHAETICRLEVPEARSMGGSHVAACHFAGELGFSRAEMASQGVGQ